MTNHNWPSSRNGGAQPGRFTGQQQPPSRSSAQATLLPTPTSFTPRAALSIGCRVICLAPANSRQTISAIARPAAVLAEGLRPVRHGGMEEANSGRYCCSWFLAHPVASSTHLQYARFSHKLAASPGCNSRVLRHTQASRTQATRSKL